MFSICSLLSCRSILSTPLNNICAGCGNMQQRTGSFKKNLLKNKKATRFFSDSFLFISIPILHSVLFILPHLSY
jgi:hypothetical protein